MECIGINSCYLIGYSVLLNSCRNSYTCALLVLVYSAYCNFRLAALAVIDTLVLKNARKYDIILSDFADTMWLSEEI